MRELSRRGLIGSEEGWSLAPIAAWLMLEARRIPDPVDLLEELARRLEIAGAQLGRLGFTLGTIHPQILAWGCFWKRGQGASMFAGWHGVENSDAYIGSPVQYVREQKKTFRRRLTDLEEDRDAAVLFEVRAEGMTDYVALPLHFSAGNVNFLSAATYAEKGFTVDDLDRLEALTNLLAPLLEIMQWRRMTLGLLDAFVGPRISARILGGQVKRGDGDRIEAAFWYSDLRGFTSLSESLPAEQLLSLLNEYFENCAAAAASRGGEILQFIGDAILIVFEIRTPSEEAKVCDAAYEAAIDAFSAIDVANHRRRHAGLPEIEFGLGLHLGIVTHANVGAPNRLAFNVVGPAVNRTARIEALSKETGEHLLMSEEFAKRLNRPLRRIGKFDLRGVAGAHEVYAPEKEL